MKYSIILLLVLVLPKISLGQDLDTYLIQAAENNPGLQSSYHEYLAALEKIPQAGGLPDPELTAGLFFNPMSRFMGNQVADIRLMQQFPWFGTLKTKKSMESQLAESAYFRFLDQKSQLFFLVKSTWFDLVLIQHGIGLLEEEREVLKLQESLLTTNLKAGNTTPMPQATMRNSGMQAILQLQLEINTIDNKIAIEIRKLNNEKIKFNQLLNQEKDAEIFIPNHLTVKSEELMKPGILDSIWQNNPQVARIEAEAEALRASQKLSKLAGMPNLGAGLNFMPFQPRIENNQSIGGEDMLMPMVSISLPIYRKKYKAMENENLELQEAKSFERAELQNQLTRAWAEAVRDFEIGMENQQLYEKQLELIESQLNLTTKNFESGNQPLFEVLELKRKLFMNEHQLEAAKNLQLKSLAKLEMLLGK
jgi:outer membrane protein TolC